MAVLQKIRKRSGLLLLAIGFALLAFVVQDLITKGFKSQSKDVGSINGKDISFDQFRIKVANVEKNAQNGQPMTQTQAANQVWDQEVAIALLNEQLEKAGIRCSENSIIEVFKKDPNIGQNPTFLNQVGKFDLNKFKEFFKNNPEQAKAFEDRQKDAEINAKFQIYSAMIKGGMYATKADGEFKYKLESDKVNFDYVSVLYSTVKDSDVKVTDADVTDYMKKNEKRFKAEETREIEYVLIEDKPSAKDEEEVKAKVNGLLSGSVVYNSQTGKNDTLPSFKSATNVAEFVNENSDKPYDSTYVTKQDLPAEHADKLFALSAGEIYGPYINGKYYCLSKAMGRKAGAKAKASHILISWEGTKVPNKKEKRTKEQAKAKAESLLAQVQANPSSFMMLALTNSDDSSAQQGGDLGYFQPGQMVKPFNDFVFNNPVGKIGLVETEFGYHIINVTDKQDAIRLATIAQKIEASDATSNEIYTKATQFEMDAQNKDFAAVAKAAKLTINPPVKAKAMDEAFGVAGNQRQIVKWAYSEDTNVGDVKRFEVVNVGNIIARLKKINEKGLMPVEDAKPMVESIIKNKKKAEKIMAKMKGATLEEIAKTNATTVQNAPAASVENSVLANVGAEPKVVGAAFGTPMNKVSAPIEGNSGVYVVKTKTVTKAPKLPKYDDYINKVKAANAQASGRIFPALKNDAKIDDNRLEFY
ncbi:peptidylprolyl isomerase [Flavobacterium aciduliphilum]|uniref:Periplasmic chaperone PpiD n=1 Tax=Flavobacterium aciduliphilum TaxID=1101402 RepID=A0A328YPL4_9FLAO|nr:peptidylprolyl isomerase [Flavobacterium aciduliphilum]RAR74102.1 peptidyl-prolyl cis-trans isomerase D [Flavobacterium aciduliphilum]